MFLYLSSYAQTARHLWGLKVALYGKAQPLHMFSPLDMGGLISILEYAVQGHQVRAVGWSRCKGLKARS